MRERLDHRHCSARRNLAGDHQFQPSDGLSRDRVQHPEDVLYRVPISQSVPLAGINEAGRPRPGVRHQAVERTPHVQHAVQLGVGRLHRQPPDPVVPMTLQFGQFFGGFLDRAELGHHPLTDVVRGPHAQQDQKLPGLAGIERDVDLESPATVVARGQRVRALPLFHHHGIGVPPVGPDEGGAVRVVARNVRADDGQKGVPSLVLLPRIIGHVGEVHIGTVVNDVAEDVHLQDVLCVLEVHLVVACTPVAYVLDVGERSQAARCVTPDWSA